MVGSEKETRVIHSPRLGEVIHYIVLTDQPAPRGKKKKTFSEIYVSLKKFLIYYFLYTD